MQPRFVGRLGLADAVTVTNAFLGFLATVAVLVDVQLAARLILVAAIADGLDGVVARRFGSTPAGKYLDSLADVASFAVAPALLVFVLTRESWGLTLHSLSAATVVAVLVPGLFVAMAVTRLGLYTAYDVTDDQTEGVQTTLAATIVATAVLAGLHHVALLLVLTAFFAFTMVTTVVYPDLYVRDALVMGVVQALALIVPSAFQRLFPRLLLVFAMAYLLFSPRFYWRDSIRASGVEGKRS